MAFDAQACIIGAGAAGLAAGKALAERGIDFDWFEKGSYIGGLWQIDNDNGGAAAYNSLHLNSSRPRTQYPSYPMPEDWPDYPPHWMVAQYFEDFADTAAAIACLDFVISVDTAVAHLAGAIGKPVWILLASRPDWRWLLGRSDSPWYPQAVLFRQAQRGDWRPVLARVRERLLALPGRS